MSRSSRNSLPSHGSGGESGSDQRMSRACSSPGRGRMERGLVRETERVAGRTSRQPRGYLCKEEGRK
jgi:hypothetical protein